MANQSYGHPPGWGADLSFDQRPGVPKLKTPVGPMPGAHQVIPPQPVPEDRPTKRMEIATLTPVFGTAQLPHGVSGTIRRLAYRIPEHKAPHWLLLLMADRVDVWGHRLGKGSLTLLGGSVLMAGGWLLSRALRGGPARRRLIPA